LAYTHNYTDEGTYALKIVISDGGTPGTVTANLTITDQPIVGSAFIPTTIFEGQQVTAGNVFFDHNPGATVSDYALDTIVWGDGTTSSVGSPTNPLTFKPNPTDPSEWILEGA
jgi:hypothetical protein